MHYFYIFDAKFSYAYMLGHIQCTELQIRTYKLNTQTYIWLHPGLCIWCRTVGPHTFYDLNKLYSTCGVLCKFTQFKPNPTIYNYVSKMPPSCLC